MHGFQQLQALLRGEEARRGRADTHQLGNFSLQLLVVASAGNFQRRVKWEVKNAKGQEEHGDPERRLGKSLTAGGGGESCAMASATGSSPGTVAGRGGGHIRVMAGN